MEDFIQESKQLALEIKANEDKYISGELDLIPALNKTDQLYHQADAAEKPFATKYLQDSGLLQLETKIARQSARSYKLLTLSFEPRNFSVKTRNFLGLVNSDEDCRTSSGKNSLSTLLTKLGEYSKETMYTVPNFNYIYGIFDADPVEPVRKKRKQTIKDKIDDITKPQQVECNDTVGGRDIMNEDASRILECFIKLTNSSKSKALCFYEFVIDPTSFTRTVEQIFLVSLLVQHGALCIFADDQGLPCIKKVEANEKEGWSSKVTQTALSISMDEWKSLIKTFNFKTPVIPPSTTRMKQNK